MSLDDDFSAFLEEVDKLPAADEDVKVASKMDEKDNIVVKQKNDADNTRKRKLNNETHNDNDISGFKMSVAPQIYSQSQPQMKKMKLNYHTNQSPPILNPNIPVTRPIGYGRGGNINKPAWMTQQPQQQMVGRPPLLNPTPATINRQNTLPQVNVQAVFGPTIPPNYNRSSAEKTSQKCPQTTESPLTATSNNVILGVAKTKKDWPENDFRLFVGDLDAQVKEEHLNDAFSKYKSFAMSRVIVNHKTSMSKGYGFVSFLDPYDCYNAMKEMNRKVLMGRPITLKVDQNKTKYNPKNIKAKERKRKKFFKRFK
jgi:hypothetical protein